MRVPEVPAVLSDLLVMVCRSYQRLFPGDYPGERRLIELHEGGDREAFYREYFAHELEKARDSLALFERCADDWARSRVLDFGCGGGGMTCHLATRFREAWGIDLDADKLAFAGREAARIGLPNVHFVHYAGGRLPFEDATFDYVYTVDVMEHLPDPAFYVGEFERVLRPGGHLLLSFGPPWRHPHGKHMWTKLPGWWTHLLFPRSVVMRVRGFDPRTTWEELGLHRLTVAKFEAILQASRLREQYYRVRINRLVAPLGAVPVLREFFVAGVLGIFEKAGRAGGR